MGNGCSSDVSEKAPIAPLEQLPALKIAIVGDPGVGKTSVLLRYLRNQFSPLYIPTKKVAIENVVRKVNVPAHTVVSLTFWDIPGREDMDIHKAYFRNLDAAIVVVDLTNKATIDMANVWRQTVVNKLTKTVPIDGNNNPGEPMVTEEPVEDPFNFPVLLLGNKLDIIESEIYEGIVNKQVSVSVDVDADGVLELKHPQIDHLQDVAQSHHFIGCVTVSAKQSDNSVAMAIQSLVRNILEKRNIPRKWRPVVEEPKPPQNDQPFIYDKLKKTDMEKYDEIIVKADEFLKETMVLRHYYTVSLARFKHTCQRGRIVEETREPSLEDCITGMRASVAHGSSLKVEEDEGFCKLEVIPDDEEQEVKQSKSWKQAYRVFHNEYAAVSKAILRDGPSICIGLEKYDKGFDKMYANFASHQAPTNEKARDKNEVDPEEVANKIVHNRAKIQHAKQEMEEAMKAVEQAARKIANVEHW
ncbi:uncharacterized protein LOC128236477 isoform X2 [Mya arenaria]|uniref:uncharacterized protein LOC128236477 isoform X2 n=1 Tax=Mya arenaria TaxID=6604 RepID=UPI0022DEA690|nr:uncharacterized protein LOC128236477 isoform X2 [Mya arenaria]